MIRRPPRSTRVPPGDKRGSLLPKYGGHPGLVYAQIPLAYARDAEAARPPWLPMYDARRYTIIGPKGSIDMELMAQGRAIRGLPPSACKRQCLWPKRLICEVTGLDPATGFPPTEVPTNVQEPQQPDTGRENGGEPIQVGSQDPKGQTGGPGADKPSGSGKGSGHSQASKK
jgi:hypothetical protein